MNPMIRQRGAASSAGPETPGSPEVRVSIADKGLSRTRPARPLAPTDDLWEALDELEQQVERAETGRAIAEVLGAGTVAYAGYLFLNTRAVSLMLTLLTARPLWNQVDPLRVLLEWEEEKKGRRKPGGEDEDEESLQSLIELNRVRERDGGDLLDVATEPGPHKPNSQLAARRARARVTPR
jgi:hypothetical protein